METKQTEALFLPFMQIPTGHHHVADAVMEELQRAIKPIHCEKVDILSYSYGGIEKIVSTTYLNWIKVMPRAYDVLYHRLAVKNQTKRTRQFLYEAMFTTFFKKLMRENEPNILFCTHCLPSNIAAMLKQKKKLQAITVNVYTDYFVNRVWGIHGIDYHFVPTISVKHFLMNLGVDESRIYLTGIPVHPVFQKRVKRHPSNKPLSVLIAGGSLGIGSIERILPNNPELSYKVLCGRNRKLYQKLKAKNHPFIQPISYIDSKEQINDIYNKIDAVITKPGGVTISESLQKWIPIFTCNALPGQEKVNELELKKLGLVNPLHPFREPIEQEINQFFTDEKRQASYMEKVQTYHDLLEKKSLSKILMEICERHQL